LWCFDGHFFGAEKYANFLRFIWEYFVSGRLPRNRVVALRTADSSASLRNDNKKTRQQPLLVEMTFLVVTWGRTSNSTSQRQGSFASLRMTIEVVRWEEQATAKTNMGVLRCAQDDKLNRQQQVTS
jgi:hypothetical protein